MASGCTGQEPQQHKDWRDSRIQSLLMDRQVAKEIRDAPIRISRADVIGIIQTSSDYWLVSVLKHLKEKTHHCDLCQSLNLTGPQY